MMKQTINKLCLFTVLVFLINHVPLHAQQSNTMYFMKGIPQAQMYNPAYQPKCNVFIGIPGVSNLGIDVANNSLNLNDVLRYSKDVDTSSLLTLNPLIGGPDEFLDNFGRKNYFSGLANIDVLSFGFRKDDKYFTFAYRIKASARFLYPTDFIRLPLEGIEHGNEFDWSDFRADATAYQEFSFGISKQYDPYLSLGVSTKILFGLANASQRKTNIGFTLNPLSVPIHASFIQNMNIPLAQIAFTNERIDSIYFDENSNPSDIIKHAFSNMGLGFDFGLNYNFDERLAISASILDIGFIRWRSNPINIEQNADFVLLGAYFDAVGAKNDTTYFDERFLNDFIDSLDNNLIIEQNSKNKYSTALPTKIYLGGTYMVNKNIQIGLLSRTEFFKKKMYQQLTFSTSFFPNTGFTPTFSYTMMNKSYFNLGFGASIKVGCVHLYFVSDNIPVVYAKEVNEGYPVPYKTKSANFHFGLNLLFGCNKTFKDRPIIE
ncbi:MAG: hypothetical protein JXB49_13575 [Bacteroidales bacterium]|nr:hypothetical protein [Bacteroidales bacterium]